MYAVYGNNYKANAKKKKNYKNNRSCEKYNIIFLGSFLKFTKRLKALLVCCIIDSQGVAYDY